MSGGRCLRALLWLVAAALSAEDVPQWVRQAAAMRTPAYPARVSSAVLLQEEWLTVDAQGRRAMRERAAVKILQKGRRNLTAFRAYNTKSGRIREFRGWLLLPGGKEIAFGKSRIVDVALAQEYTYDEGRAKFLECDAGAPEGSVFAYEIVEEEDTIFTQYHYRFQDEAPVLVSRFVLTLPPGWEARGTIFNRDGSDPNVAGSTYTWEIRDLAAFEDEEYSPRPASLAPRLALTYYPSADQQARLRPLKDWRSVSTWLTELVDPAAEVTPAVRSKAAELTGAAKTELEKIRAIASFAQQTNYVSVQMNVTRGGGYVPHRAEEVLRNRYGDCKDKATLMRALLRAAGIEPGFPFLSVYS